MQRAMARQAEAERERRAKIINADGELQASERLAEAGRVMSETPATLQLRFLQTLSEVATEKNSTIVFPVPIDLLSLVSDRLLNNNGNGGGERPRVRVGGGDGGAAAHPPAPYEGEEPPADEPLATPAAGPLPPRDVRPGEGTVS
jgi:hypothetical protein